MEVFRNAGESALIGARATLLMLRASLPEGSVVAPDGVVLPPDTEVLNDRVASEVLATRRPVECIAVARNGALEVKCAPLSEHEAQASRWFQREMGGYINSAVREALRASRSSLILLVGRGESMVVEASVLETAYLDYVIIHDGFLLGGRNLNPDEQALGIGWVWEVGHAKRVEAE